MAGKCEKALARLHGDGHTLLASEVAGLVPQKNACAPGLEALQHRYLRQQGQLEAQRCSGCMPLQVQVGPPGQGQPLGVSMEFELTQAPAAFTMPVMQKRPFELPFQVKVTWSSTAPLTIATSVSVYAINEGPLSHMADWCPPGAASRPSTTGKLLTDGQQERVIALEPAARALTGNSPQQTAYVGQTLFSFTNMRFAEPSAMQPRWLVFAAPTCDGGLVYTLFRLPTIVMCRFGDQMERARKLLWGAANPLEKDMSCMDYHAFRHFVKGEMRAEGVMREPSADDLRHLAGAASFLVGPDGSVARNSADQACLNDFRPWFDQQMAALRSCKAYYERSNPTIICGFSVTREVAEAALQSQPRGAFLLRFGSSQGALVLSVATQLAGSSDAADSSASAVRVVVHWQLTQAELSRLGLGGLVERIAQRQGRQMALLDLQTGLLHPLQAVFSADYQRSQPSITKGAETPGQSKRCRLSSSSSAAGTPTKAGGSPASSDSDQRSKPPAEPTMSQAYAGAMQAGVTTNSASMQPALQTQHSFIHHQQQQQQQQPEPMLPQPQAGYSSQPLPQQTACALPFWSPAAVPSYMAMHNPTALPVPYTPIIAQQPMGPGGASCFGQNGVGPAPSPAMHYPSPYIAAGSSSATTIPGQGLEYPGGSTYFAEPAVLRGSSDPGAAMAMAWRLQHHHQQHQHTTVQPTERASWEQGAVPSNVPRSSRAQDVSTRLARPSPFDVQTQLQPLQASAGQFLAATAAGAPSDLLIEQRFSSSGMGPCAPVLGSAGALDTSMATGAGGFPEILIGLQDLPATLSLCPGMQSSAAHILPVRGSSCSAAGDGGTVRLQGGDLTALESELYGKLAVGDASVIDAAQAAALAAMDLGLQCGVFERAHHQHLPAAP